MDREEARARMLRLWMTLSDSNLPTTIHTTQRFMSTFSSAFCSVNLLLTVCCFVPFSTVVNADSVIVNGGQTLFACTNLETPLGTYQHAVLRDQDIAQLHRPLTNAELRALVLDNM